MRRLLRSYFTHRREFSIAMIGALVVIAVSVVHPLVIGRIIDRVIQEGRRDLLVPLTAAVLALAAVKGAGIYVRKRWAGHAAVGTEAKLRAQLYEHLQALDIAYHERVATGQLMSRATSDLHAGKDFLSMIPIVLAMITFLLVVSAVMLTKDLPLALATLAGVPLMGPLGARLTRRLHPEVYETQQNLARLTTVAEETVTGIRVVKVFGREDLQVARLTEEADRVYTHANNVIRIRALLQPLFDFYPALTLAIVLWFGGGRVLSGAITYGEFVTFFIYVTQLQWPVKMFGWVASDGQKAASAASRIFEVLDTQPGIADRPGARNLDVSSSAVRFENVAYSFDGRRNVVDGITLDVGSGDSVALVGPTGCGKSTLLRLVLRFLEPNSGRITLGEADIREVTLESLRNEIGVVFEETFLFSDTVAANIAFGRPGAAEDEVIHAAALARAHDFIAELPDGYDTILGEQGYTLSGGQRQRVAIARAILMDPKVLLLDDATSSVDARMESEIRHGLSEAMSGRTTLIVARRPQSAALADRVVFLDSGHIVAQGTHEELWERLGAYRETLAGSAAAPAEAAVVRSAL